MSKTLKAATITAGIWSISGSFLQTFLQLVISVALARLLTPEDYGLLAMVLLFPEIGRVFSEGGFGIALVHRKNATRCEETSILAFNCLIASCFCLGIWFAAPYISDFYSQPRLTGLLRLSSVGLIFTSLGIVQTSILSRNLKFRAMTLVTLISSTVSGCLAIFLAVKGFGVWALVWQGVSNAVLVTVMLWVVSPWRPSCSVSFSGLRSMGGFGINMLLTNIVSIIFGNMSTILIGRYFSPDDLGFFNRAMSFQAIPINAFSSALGKVMLPALVHVNDESEKMSRAYRKAMQVSIAFTAPLMCGCIFLATPLIQFVFSDKWLPAVPYFQLFCAGGIIFPLHVLNINILLALGRPDLQLLLEVVKNVLSLAICFAAIRFGVLAMAFGVLLFATISLPINAYFPGKLTGITLRVQLREVFPYILCAMVAMGCGWGALQFVDLQPIGLLAVLSPLFMAVYLLSSLLIRENIFLYLLRNQGNIK